MLLTIRNSALLYGPRLRRGMRIGSLGISLLFLCMLGIFVLYNSSKRNSVLTQTTSTSMAESYFAGLEQASTGTSRLRLQDFHRVAIKDGRTIWEVRAKDAQYYSSEGVTHLDGAALKLYQEEGGTISLNSKAAKLHMSGQKLSRAELMGEVVVEWESGMKFESASALYEVTEAEITAAEAVKISGQGYLVKGVGFRALIDEQRVALARNVQSVFTGKSEGRGGNSALSLLEGLGK